MFMLVQRSWKPWLLFQAIPGPAYLSFANQPPFIASQGLARNSGWPCTCHIAQIGLELTIFPWSPDCWPYRLQHHAWLAWDFLAAPAPAPGKLARAALDRERIRPQTKWKRLHPRPSLKLEVHIEDRCTHPSWWPRSYHGSESAECRKSRLCWAAESCSCWWCWQKIERHAPQRS